MPSDDTSGFSTRSLLHSLKAGYTTQRDAFTESIPFGQTVWDGLRIVSWVSVFIGLSLLLTGVITPIVSVTSESMEPNINAQDAVIIVEHDPDSPPILASNNGVIPTQNGRETHHSFGMAGTVIVFDTTSNEIPIMHRTRMEVDAGENWVKRGDEEYLPRQTECDDVQTCPAKTDGYITAGDNNLQYDQLGDIPIVETSEVRGIVRYRVPYWSDIRGAIE